ncbi:type VI secretion system baseplate subunit TssG [Azospirillum rugosum]|uniref:Type VI secretion system protein ImpH n=1 Tax=Azospirillum rugosum TaxID=416170 RepID=A0ABS4SMA5_9PROT|nr:type VI secretion system baseplate subunit TssG [Azospirillum rugosum]MBP2293213.1 type VI secretion system protein ImpH [Azospirillum rugosum]
MAGARGRADSPVTDELAAEPWRFDFVQAVRLLEAAARAAGYDRQPVGGNHPRGEDAVRFRSLDTMAYPAAEVPRVDLRGDGADMAVPVMAVSVLGLTGPLGVLPQHYTAFVHECRRSHNPALADFLDIFHHRILSLFARAAGKYHLGLSVERAATAEEPDPITAVLQALAGVQGMAPPLAPTLVHYAGHLSQRRASAAALEAMLSGDLGLPVRIEQFQGAWLALPEAEQSRLGGAFCTLGVDAMAGERAWDVQSRFRVVIGPVSYQDFDPLLPGGTRLERVAALTRFQVGEALDFDVQLVLKREEVPECRLAEAGAFQPRLGWNTWLKGGEFEVDAGDAVVMEKDTAMENSNGVG